MVHDKLESVPSPVPGVEAVEVYEVRPVSVYEGTEGQAVSPAGGHVSDPDPGVVIKLPPTPLL